MLYLAILLLIIAVVLFWQASRRQKAAGLPGGRIIYTDTRAWGAVEKPFYDPSLGLTGKPDYLVEKGKVIIPVEVKSSRIPEAPYDSHIFQLAAYCLLVERVLGSRPPYGILHYAGSAHRIRTFAIDYTPQLEEAILDLLGEIRSQDQRKNIERSHQSPARCRRCGFQSICEQRIH